jgi:small glutamine-rich tetratricopeptide repeat-containing protein alpha
MLVRSSIDKSDAEKYKATGNAHLHKKQYHSAILSYTCAVSLDPSNPIYYSNRAAAHSHLGEHAKAVDDAKKALQVAPSYVKAYSRLG